MRPPKLIRKNLTLWRSFFLAGFLSHPAAAEELVDLESREVWSAEKALADAKILIYVTKDCPACGAYLARLEACDDLAPRLRFVALETPARAKEMQSKLVNRFKFAVRRVPNDGPTVDSTPSTRGAKSTAKGILSCAALRALP